jgi:NAD-dependent dihydropyrimidine dehydrogenase PreA subunit
VSDTSNEVRHIEIEWGPTLDADLCTGCGTCIDWCKHDVYRWSEDGDKVEVETRTNCVVGCSHCGTLCETEALSFPTFEEIKRLRRGE